MRKTGAIIPAREEEPPAAPIDLRKLFPFLCYGLIAPWNIGISVAKFNRGKKTRTKYSLESPDDMERFLEKKNIHRAAKQCAPFRETCCGRERHFDRCNGSFHLL
ncbi:MAG: hypothetical protein B1H13_14120 [Desulfobacteraceae bacterium 4484_190.3]|nr:MAG: hypothetical protein B1H13_14120 [Desulfobacteraceae bacterium 4484_190.3]